MDDLISRQAAIEAAKKLLDYYGTNDITKEYADHTAEQFMNRVPSAQSELMMLPAADVVEVDKVQKEVDYWHDLAQSYEQTITKLTLCQADVVEVVRCKDCKWFNNIGCAIKIVDDSDKPKDNDYCSFGERA